MASATNPPPGATITPVPVAFARSGRYGIKVGLTTLRITVPSGVFGTVSSFWVQRSEPGATPGQMFTTCARPAPSAKQLPAAVSSIVRRISPPALDYDLNQIG